MATVKRRDSEAEERANRISNLFACTTPTCYNAVLLDKIHASHRKRRKLMGRFSIIVFFFFPGILMRNSSLR